MRIEKIIRRVLRTTGEGVQAVGDVDAVILVNVAERGESASTHVRSHKRVVQRSSGPTRTHGEPTEQEDR